MEDIAIGGSGAWERGSGDNFGGEREDEQTAGVPGRSLSATNNSRIQGIIIKILVFFTLRSILTTRLHSSRMRTARVLTVSPSMLCTGGCLLGGCIWSGRGVVGGVPGRGGGCLLWGVYLVWGVSALGVYLVLGGICSGGCLLPGGAPGPGGGVSAPQGGYQVLPPPPL